MATEGVQMQAHMQQPSLAKHACTLCASRKVGCDKELPVCGNCVKHRAECRYEEPKPSQRRKRRADGELVDRINYLEALLRKHGIEPAAGEDTSTFLGWTPDVDQAARPRVKTEQTRFMPPIKAGTSDTDGSLKLPLDNPTWLKFMEKSTPNDSSVEISASLSPSITNLLHLHPEPRHILRLWQVFTERSNPVIKVLHAPSIQQRILDTSWNLEMCSNSFHALLFSIYLLAVVSLSPDECHQHFQEAKSQLLNRYKTAAWQALLSADLFHTRELEVLQAFVLFTLSDSRSDTSTTLSALAVRIALKMGLGKEQISDKVSVFEEEMRIRLWWQIITQDVLARHYFVGRDGTNTDGLIMSTIRLPLNVNDAELHPDMVKLPSETPRATEMIYVLMRYEGGAFGQRARTQMQQFVAAKSNPFEELKKLFHQKYTQFCDPQIPLHNAATSMFGFAQASMRYRLTCQKATETPISQDELLSMAVDVMHADKASRDNPFADQLLWRVSPVDLDAAIHTISKLRHKNSGDLITRAWDAVVDFWDEHIGGDWEGEAGSQTSFFARLADLTLEAWQARRRALVESQGLAMADEWTPDCIKRLRNMRHVSNGDETQNADPKTVLPPLDDTLPSLSEFDFLNTDDFPPDLFGFGNDLLYDFGLWADAPKV